MSDLINRLTGWAMYLDSHADAEKLSGLRSDLRALLDDPCVAPGARDFTFGSVLSEMIRHMFQRVDGRAAENGRHYTECLQCKGADMGRRTGARPSLELVKHDPDCLFAKHLPRIKAMANRDVT